MDEFGHGCPVALLPENSSVMKFLTFWGIRHSAYYHSYFFPITFMVLYQPNQMLYRI
jgi:hypothetical protein